MIEFRDIRPGALVDVTANGGLHRMYVTGMKDGRVSFNVKPFIRRGGWWLPVDHVRMHATLIEPGPKRPSE